MDLRIYGAGASRLNGHPLRSKWQGKIIFHDEKIKAVLAAKIVVNSSHFGEIQSANARTFEVAGIGGFQVADAPGLANYFRPGEEIVQFNGPKSLRESVAYYLNRPEERGAMAARAQARAHKEHTYEQRLKRLLRVVGLTNDRIEPESC
jgi:spore maturation protein CgeB